MLPMWVQIIISLGNLAYQGFRLWLDYRDKIKKEDINTCAIKIEQARKNNDPKKMQEILEKMKELGKCE